MWSTVEHFASETLIPSEDEDRDQAMFNKLVPSMHAPRSHPQKMAAPSTSTQGPELLHYSSVDNAFGKRPRVEPAETQQMKMNGDVRVDIKQLVAKSVIKDFRALPPLSNRCCIYRVPERLRGQLNGKAYTPQSVSIGPLHHGKKKLKEMEEHKKRYLQEFLLYFDLNIEAVIQVIEKNEQKLRDCYAETLALSSEAFVKIMLVDATFIIMLMLKYCDLRTTTDRIFDNPQMILDVIPDMVMLENQIPFFILKRLFKLLPPHSSRAAIEHTHRFFKGQWGSWVRDDILEKIDLSSVEHFVDFLSKCQKIKKNQSAEELKITLQIPSALELHQAGVKFKKGSSQKLHDITFQEGTLEIPPLIIDDSTEVFLKNLLAFEECHFDSDSLDNYVFMISSLVKSSKDAEILIQEGIIEDWRHDTDAAVSLLHNLGKGVYITPEKFSFLQEVKQLNKYCKRRMNRWKAALKQKHFNNPWTILSVVAAGILLILTVIQTVCSILQVIIG